VAEEKLPEDRPIVTLEEAKAAGLKRYFTGKSCPKGHVAERRVNGKACVECAKANVSAWTKANPDKMRESFARYRSANQDEINDRNRNRKEFPCRHCGEHIDFPEIRPDAQRVSRPKYCSDHCRLYSKVSQAPGHGPDGDCWEFQGSKHRFGYGMINMSGTKASDIKTAHAVAWIIAYGSIPDGMFVCHKCDHPPCCRPDHLFLGTHQDNMDDMVKKGRGGFRFTQDQVKQILSEYGTDEEIAEKFGCSASKIWRIRTGQTWRNV